MSETFHFKRKNPTFRRVGTEYKNDFSSAALHDVAFPPLVALLFFPLMEDKIGRDYNITPREIMNMDQ